MDCSRPKSTQSEEEENGGEICTRKVYNEYEPHMPIKEEDKYEE